MTFDGVARQFDGHCPECGIEVSADNLGLHATVMHKGTQQSVTPPTRRAQLARRARTVTDRLVGLGAIICAVAVLIVVSVDQTKTALIACTIIGALGYLPLLAGVVGKVVALVVSAASEDG